MGYCIYWERLETMPAVWAKFIELLPKVVQLDRIDLIINEDYVSFTEKGNEGSGAFIARAPRSTFHFEPQFCKTGRAPYTEDVMAVCILMAELGMAVGLTSNDDNTFAWQDTLLKVAGKIPLTSLMRQIGYFVRLGAAKAELNPLEPNAYTERILNDVDSTLGRLDRYITSIVSTSGKASAR